MSTKNQWTLLAVGLMAGACLTYFWPHEPAHAIAVDRDSKFAMCTVPVTAGVSGGVAGVPGPASMPLEGVFVLDFLTGRLQGAVVNNRNGKFTHAYFRNVAADFQVDPKAEPHYAFLGGTANLPGSRGVTPASGLIYVAELTSGKVICYTFPYRESNRPLPPVEMTPTDFFQFRETSQP